MLGIQPFQIETLLGISAVNGNSGIFNSVYATTGGFDHLTSYNNTTITLEKSIIPDTGLSLNLGSSSNPFNTIYTNNLNLPSLTPSRIVVTDGSRNITTGTLSSNLTLTGSTLDTVQNITTSSSPQFAAIKLTTGAVNGYVLTSDASGNGSWSALSGISVTSITGTANQCLVNSTSGSAQTGAITLTTPQNIGTASNVQFGTLGIGVANNSNAVITSTSTVSYNTLLNGTQTAQTGNNEYCIYVNPTLAPSANATGFVSGIGIDVTYNPANTTTTTNAVGVYVKANAQGGAGGTVTNAYGGYFEAPTAGSHNAAIYAANLAIGSYTATSPPSNGLIVSGISAFGTSSAGTVNQVNISPAISATITTGLLISPTYTNASGTLYGERNTTAFNPPNASTYTAIYGLNIAPTHTPTGTGTSTTAYGVSISGINTSANTITTSYGLYCTGASGAGTITTSYTGYFANPATGSTKVSLYTDNLSVGYTATTPPSSNGSIFAGPVVVGNSGTLSSTGGALQVSLSTSAATNDSIGPYGNGSATVFINSYRQASVNTTVLASIFNYPAPGTLAGKTVTYGCGIYNSNYLGFNSGTTTNAIGIFCDTMQATSGTITNAYNGYFANPGLGTHQCALYADNLSIGYTATTPPTNGVIVSGKSYFGASSIASNLTSAPVYMLSGAKASGTSYQLILATTDASNAMELSFGSYGTATTANQGMIIQSTIPGVSYNPLYLQPLGSGVSIGNTTAPTPTYAVNAAVSGSRHANFILSGNSFDGSSSTDGVALCLVHNASGNRQICFGDSANLASSSSTTMVRITNGGTIDAIATDASTSKQIQVGNATGGIYSPGSVGIGTSNPSASALLHMVSTTQGYVPPNMTSTQKSNISSPATGLSVYDTTNACPSWYTGSAWNLIPGYSTTGNLSITWTGALSGISSNIYCSKVGDVVTVTFAGLSATASANNSINGPAASIPSGYQPATAKSFQTAKCYTNSPQVLAIGNLAIATDGSTTMNFGLNGNFVNSSTSGWTSFSVTYSVNL